MGLFSDFKKGDVKKQSSPQAPEGQNPSPGQSNEGLALQENSLQDASPEKLLASFERLRGIVLELNDKLGRLSKDFYEVSSKEAFNEFKKEILEEKEKFASEGRQIAEQISSFKKMMLRQGVTRRDIDDLLYKIHNLEIGLRQASRNVDAFSGAINELKDKHALLEGKLRNGLNVLKEELSLDEDAINRLVVRNREFVRLKQDFAELERKYRFFEKGLKDLGDEGLTLRDFVLKEFRVLRSELGIVRAKATDSLRIGDALMRRVERVAPIKLDRDLDTMRRFYEESKRRMDELSNEIAGLKRMIASGFGPSDPRLALSRQIEDLRKTLKDSIESNEAFNKRVVDKLIELDQAVGQAGASSKLNAELKLLEEANARLLRLSEPTHVQANPTPQPAPVQKPTLNSRDEEIFSWIESNLNRGFTPRQLKDTLLTSNLDPSAVDRYFAMQ